MRMLAVLLLGLLFVMLAPASLNARVHVVHARAVTCSACGGNGVCWPCHGGGKRSDGERCSICGGSGRCSYCSGRGDH